MTNRILVVDDDSSLRRVMKMQLNEAGYEVSIASDGNQAYAMLKDLQPTLIITDFACPQAGLNCWDVLRGRRFRLQSLSSPRSAPLRWQWRR